MEIQESEEIVNESASRAEARSAYQVDIGYVQCGLWSADCLHAVGLAEPDVEKHDPALRYIIQICHVLS